MDRSSLLAAARNVNSQCGEDGIIAAILAAIPGSNRWCVEFGAWDGRYLSNTRRLIDEDGFSGVMIEANSTTCAELRQSFVDNPLVTCVNAFVGFSESDNLDTILEDTKCPLDFDVLSIDIDGNDLHVWEKTVRYRPKIVCIEFNPTIPSSVRFTQPRDANVKWGSSLLALFDLGQSKRYKLVCANELNAFFVAGEHWSGDFAKSAIELASFRKIEPEPIYLFSGYDGTVLLSSKASLLWHEITFSARDVQVIPRFLRRYPDDYSWVQRKVFNLVKRIRRQ